MKRNLSSIHTSYPISLSPFYIFFHFSFGGSYVVTWLHALVHALTLDVSTKTQLLYNTSLCSCCCGSRSGVITTCENQGEGQGTETEKEVSFLRHGSPFRGSSSQVTLDPGLFNPSSCEGSTRVPSRRRGCLNHFGSTTNSIPMYHGPSLWLGLNSLHASIHVFEEFMESVMETKQQKTEPMGGSVVFNE
ncbi:hypothetical protein HMI54_010517 [Coelomomyces lativittatus]|nr:hypothetical protein HMI55_000066 [Coelomomyces lativittatus]KAJ1516176.1 hypothetical protein HMI54_010517 [Coelomomyces lativittatus]